MGAKERVYVFRYLRGYHRIRIFKMLSRPAHNHRGDL